MSLLRFALACLLTAPALAQEGDHTYTSEAIGLGSRIYVQQCALCHGPGGGRVPGINLARGQFREASSDADLRDAIANGAAQGQMPAFDLTERELDGVIAFIRAGFDASGISVRIGDTARGERLFAGSGRCSECHRVNGRGPRTAPDLSDIGLYRTPSALTRALVEPASALLPINRPIRIVTKQEETVLGRRLNEDTYTVQILDANERLRSFVKAELASYEISDTPTHEPTKLTGDQVADLVAYMLTLRGEL